MGKTDRSEPTYTWASGDAYQRYVGRWSLLVANEFLDWISVPAQSDWLDVGCGIGTLVSRIDALANPRSIAGIDSSAGFIDYAKVHIRSPIATFQLGDARSIPFADGRFGAVVSGLVLNFVPQSDQPRAAGELARVADSGATVAAYVWDYAEGQQMMRYFWDAAVDLDPAARTRAEAIKFPLCHPEPLSELFAGAGLVDVDTRSIEIPTVFADFDDYWTPFLSGEAPAPGYNMSLSESARSELREELRRRLPVQPDGSISLTARAWAVKGIAA